MFGQELSRQLHRIRAAAIGGDQHKDGFRQLQIVRIGL